MEHEHDHHHDHNHAGQGNIKAAFLLNLAFTFIEIIGGIWTNSMAILSDALHDLGDSLSLGVSWYLEKYSKKGPDARYSYGYARFSLLGALINSIILIAGSVIILAKSIPRIINPEAVNSTGMLILAILGIAMNGAAALRLKKGNSLNERVVLWHLMEDVLGWAVVLIVSIVLLFVDAPIIDPILSVLITIYVLIHVGKNLKEILHVFLQGVPRDLSISEIEREITDKTGASTHHTHIWSLEGNKNLLSPHVTIGDDIEREKIIELKQEIRELMYKRGIGHVTIEIEFESEDCKDKTCD